MPFRAAIGAACNYSNAADVRGMDNVDLHSHKRPGGNSRDRDARSVDVGWEISDRETVCAMALVTGARADRTPRAKDVKSAIDYLLIALVVFHKA